MKIYDVEGNLLDESKIDLSKGRLIKSVRIKSDATPVDNITKFAWDDTDYESITRYVPYTQEELEEMNRPSDFEVLKTDIKEIKRNLNAIMNLLNGGAKSDARTN